MSVMKNLVTIIAFLTVSFSAFSQEKANETTAVINVDATTVIKEIKSLNKDVVLSNTTKKKLLIQNNFDKSAFLFRGKKSRREKIC